jgi:hypothetical protein
MVLLVRCKDNTCSVALESRLNDLVNDGLVTAYLRNDQWVTVQQRDTRRICTSPIANQSISPSPVAAAV